MSFPLSAISSLRGIENSQQSSHSHPNIHFYHYEIRMTPEYSLIGFVCLLLSITEVEIQSSAEHLYVSALLPVAAAW